MRKIDDFLNRVPEKTLFHYTGASGLVGILESGQIWASSAYHLNDSGEFRYAWGLIRDRFSSRLGAEHGPEKDKRDEFLYSLTQVPKAVQAYVASFSEEGDLLSQWLAYPRSGSGYSIGLAPAQFETAKNEGFQLVRCVYGRDEQVELVDAIIGALIEKETLETIGTETGRGQEEAIISKILVAAAALKHPGFEREAEWRLVKPVAVGIGVSREVHFREGRNGVVPYLRAPLVARSEPFRPEAIFIGPNGDMDAAQVAIDTLLDARGFGRLLWSVVKVECSKTPYRP